MRTEPDLDHDRLRGHLLQRYGLDVARLTFVPYGIDSWSYVAASPDGSRVFVKLTSRGPSTGGPSQEFPLMAALAAGLVPVPRPIAARDGRFSSPLDEYDVNVMEYLEGDDLEDETAWADDLYGRVAGIVAAVHASTGAVRHLVEHSERYDLPFLPPFAETLSLIAAGGGLPAGDAPTLVRLRKMVLPRVEELRLAIGRLEELRDLAVGRDSEVALCHTDIWGSNLLRSADGALHLVDWGGALLGPPEADLFMFAGTVFFPAERFGWFLDRYEAAFRRVRVDATTYGFYLYRRELDDLAGFVDSIATGRTEAMGPDAALGVLADLLAELPRLEARIGHAAAVLEERDRRAAAGPR